MTTIEANGSNNWAFPTFSTTIWQDSLNTGYPCYRIWRCEWEYKKISSLLLRLGGKFEDFTSKEKDRKGFIDSDTEPMHVLLPSRRQLYAPNDVPDDQLLPTLKSESHQLLRMRHSTECEIHCTASRLEWPKFSESESPSIGLDCQLLSRLLDSSKSNLKRKRH